MKNLVLILCLMLTSFLLHAQKNYAVKVMDSRTNKPIAGVSVKIKATNVITVANETGTVVIQAAESDLLDISKVGYVSREIKLAGQSTIISVFMVPLEALKKPTGKRVKKG